MRPRRKFVVVEDVPREISYKVGHSWVSLHLPFNLEIHWIKNVKFAHNVPHKISQKTFRPRNPLIQILESRDFLFFHVLGDFIANISWSMRPREKFVGVENIPQKILCKVGYSRVSLDLPFNLEIQLFKNVKFEVFNFVTFSATLLQISHDLWVLGEKLWRPKMFLVKFHRR